MLYLFQSKVRKDIVEELTTLIDDLLNPFSYLDGLADPFIHAYEATFGVIKSIKEAHTILKDGYDIPLKTFTVQISLKSL